MRRAPSILAHAVGALVRGRVRALALGGGLTFAVGLIAAVLFLTDALRAEADRARAAMPDIVVQRLMGGRPTTIRATDAAGLDAIPSVRAVHARVWGYMFLPALQGNVTLVGVSDGAAPLPAGAVIATGRDRAAGAHEMVMGAGLARYMGLALGDVQGFPAADPDARPLTLVGTFASRVDAWTVDVVLCDEADARMLLGVPPSEATDLAVDVANPDETRIVARTILSRLPGARVIERDLLGRIHALAFGRRAGLMLAASVPAVLALLVLAWDRASGVGPEERREIAILKAVGWSTADVLAAKLYEALAVGVVATAAGLGLAYAWVFLLGAPGLRAAIAGWSVLYPEAPLTPVVDAAQLLGIATCVLAPYVGLSIVPAWRAASMDPVDVMRG